MVQVCFAARNRAGTKLGCIFSQLWHIMIKASTATSIWKKVPIMLWCRKHASDWHYYFEKKNAKLRDFLSPVKYILICGWIAFLSIS